MILLKFIGAFILAVIITNVILMGVVFCVERYLTVTEIDD